jgi:predicted RNase H-like HicB family nuclease
MRYRVNIKKTEEGYAVWCPGLPGCWSQGETEEEALENIKDAIQAYLETIEELSRNKESRYAFTMAGIVKDAGLSIEEFKRLL